jgi:hypothetical protein
MQCLIPTLDPAKGPIYTTGEVGFFFKGPAGWLASSSVTCYKVIGYNCLWFGQ